MMDGSPPPPGEVMREADKVEEYITRMHNMVAQYILMRTILDLCEEAKICPGMRVSKWWWEQDRLNLVRAQEATTTAEKMGDT